ncbi:MAG: PDGLE domain-containing protein [Candidatus Bathyarchaeia archaeon]|nr:PDGLE domain-containing protein [Candidatus Bathyarchaeota archaeon]
MENRKMIIFGIIISIIFVIVGCIWLSVSVETLDKIAEKFEATEISIWNPPLPDYALPGFEENVMLNISVGILFTLITFLVSFGVGKALGRKK